MNLKNFVENALSEFDETLEDVVHIRLVEDTHTNHAEFESPLDTDDPDVLIRFDGSARNWREEFPEVTIWTEDRVYVKENYDGREYFESVSRDPPGGDGQ